MILDLDVDEILDIFPDALKEGEIQTKQVNGISSLNCAVVGDLSFLGNPKYRTQVSDCLASIILLPLDYEGKPKKGQLFLKMKEPSLGLTKVCHMIEKKMAPNFVPGIHSTAFIEKSATIDPSVTIGPFSYIGQNVEIKSGSVVESHCYVGKDSSIGRNCRIFPGVKILSHCEVMDRVILNAGIVIGSEGFGFEQVEHTHKKIPHLGRVIVENDVEIGANTCIDRARFEETRIGEGTKIDNLVQIGHNVHIGKGCLIVAQVGIAGSVCMEDFVVVGGQAGFSGHITVGRGAKIAGQAGITKDVEPGAYLKGNPAMPVQLAHRISILQRKLPELFNRFAQNEGNK